MLNKYQFIPKNYLLSCAFRAFFHLSFFHPLQPAQRDGEHLEHFARFHPMGEVPELPRGLRRHPHGHGQVWWPLNHFAKLLFKY